MCRIRVFVNSTEECRGSISTNLLCQEMAATRVLVEERAHIVNESGNENQGAGLRLLLEAR